MNHRCSTLAFCGIAACGGDDPTSVEDADLDVGRRFVEDRAFRRSALEASLAVTDNGDARLRLARYAQPGEWEELPVLDVEIAPIIAGEVPVFERPLPGEFEWTRAALLELGRSAFEEWPAQRAPALGAWLGSASGVASASRELAANGAWLDDRARLGGFVWARYADGTTEPALTCSSCHARPGASGRVVHGAASDLDLGAFVGEAWGPGRVDVTSDGEDNPVAMPDLRATRHQRRLHHAGNLYNGLAALAVRTETLLITARAEVVRPPREIAFAIAYYVWSLGDEAPSPESSSPVFDEHCGRCHFDPTGAGDVVSVSAVGTGGAAALSPMRGSGGYRVPSLHRVSERTRLTHEGWPLALEQFLDPGRTVGYPGHAFGLELEPGELAALLSELSRR